MSEGEIIYKLTDMIENYDSIFNYNIGEKRDLIRGLLDLYKNLKVIEEVHRKENGKLRTELEQEKKNKVLYEFIIDRQKYFKSCITREELEKAFEDFESILKKIKED